MEILERFILDQKLESVKEDPVQRQILRILLKYEMQSLLQRLAEIGEETVVVTANVVDGTHSVLASHHGEKFLHEGVVSHFMDHFVRFLFTGETGHTTGEVSSSSDCCSLKQGICQQENNLSRSSVNSDEPETFMHMKKHQIEEFHRRKEYDDKAIDETVSNLVKNILKEGKEKERKNNSVSVGTNFPVLRRKRSLNSNNLYPISFSKEGCSEAKRKPIAHFFPTLSPMLSNNSANSVLTSPNEAVEENDGRVDDIPDGNAVMIKIEPNDIGEYGGLGNLNGNLDGNKKENRLQDQDYVLVVDNECSNKEGISDSVDLNMECVQSKSIKDVIIIQKNGSIGRGLEESGKSESSKNDVADNEEMINEEIIIENVRTEEEEIPLPMVEEFYENRDKYVEDVKLTAKEKTIEAEAAIPNVSCYRQSRKKSNTFNLVLNGYLYIKDKQSSTGTVYWKCGRSGCKGRVIQRGQELITSQIHKHGPYE